MTNKYSFYNVKKSDIFDLYDNPTESISENDNSIENTKGETKLYRDNGDGTLAILYECEKNDNSSNIITLYTPNGVYNVVSADDKINFASYMSAESFVSLINLTSKASKAPFKTISQAKAQHYAKYNSFPIVIDENIIQPGEYNILKDLYNRYSTATKYLPASNIIDSILEKINHYIATRST